MSKLLGKVVVVTQMRKIPAVCQMCKYYENMGGNRGRGKRTLRIWKQLKQMLHLESEETE